MPDIIIYKLERIEYIILDALLVVYVPYGAIAVLNAPCSLDTLTAAHIALVTTHSSRKQLKNDNRNHITRITEERKKHIKRRTANTHSTHTQSLILITRLLVLPRVKTAGQKGNAQSRMRAHAF